jgi:autotransporter adhesin
MAIGGNQITGLGQNGLTANAAEMDALAIGDGATTSVGATGAIALGAGARSSSAGSVALGSGSVADGSTLGHAAFLVGGTAAAEVNIGARRLTGLAAGAEATDAVNVAQLGAVDTKVTQLGYDVGALDGLAVKYQDSTHAAIALGGTNGTRIGNVAAGVAATDAVNVSQLNASVSAVRDDALSYDNGKMAYSANHGGTNQRITDVADGTVAAGSTDVVNGGQLAASNAAIAAHLGGGASVQADGTIAAPNYALATVATNGTTGTATYNNVGDALTSLGTSVTNVNQRIDTVAAATARAVAYDDDSGDVVTFKGANGTRLTNVQAGDVSATSTDAVNGAQLYATNSQLAANTTVVNNLRAGQAGYLHVNNTSNYAEPVATGADSIAVGGGGVASGDRSLSIGAQAQAIAANSVALGYGSVADRPNSVSVGSAGAERSLTNVADGVAPTDAVNVRQLQGGMAAAVDTANAYTDRKMAQMNTDISSLRREARAGTASAMALSAIPQPIKPGQNVVGFGMSGWQGEGALAVGMSRASNDGRFMIRAGATYNSRSQGGANAGVGFAF